MHNNEAERQNKNLITFLVEWLISIYICNTLVFIFTYFNKLHQKKRMLCLLISCKSAVIRTVRLWVQQPHFTFSWLGWQSLSILTYVVNTITWQEAAFPAYKRQPATHLWNYMCWRRCCGLSTHKHTIVWMGAQAVMLQLFLQCWQPFLD